MTQTDLLVAMLTGLESEYPGLIANQSARDAVIAASYELLAANREPEPVVEPAPVVLDAIPGWEAA